MSKQIKLSSIEWNRGRYILNTTTFYNILREFVDYLKKWVKEKHALNTKVSGEPLPQDYSKKYDKYKSKVLLGSNSALGLVPDLALTGDTHNNAMVGVVTLAKRNLKAYYQLDSAGKKKYAKLKRLYGNKWETFDRYIDPDSWNGRLGLELRGLMFVNEGYGFIKRIWQIV